MTAEISNTHVTNVHAFNILGTNFYSHAALSPTAY